MGGQTHHNRTSAIVLAKQARNGNADAAKTLLERARPESFTAFQEMVFPNGGMSHIMFNFLCDEYDAWRGISLSAAS